MMLENRKCLAGPVFQVRIIAALGITFEQRNRVLVGADLIRSVVGVEILATSALQLGGLARVRAVQHGRPSGLNLAAADKLLELGTGLGVVGDHLPRKALLRRI